MPFTGLTAKMTMIGLSGASHNVKLLYPASWHDLDLAHSNVFQRKQRLWNTIEKRNAGTHYTDSRDQMAYWLISWSNRKMTDLSCLLQKSSRCNGKKKIKNAQVTSRALEWDEPGSGPVFASIHDMSCLLMYRCRCRELPAGLSGGSLDLETAAGGHSPPSHPAPTDGRGETGQIQKIECICQHKYARKNTHLWSRQHVVLFDLDSCLDESRAASYE